MDWGFLSFLSEGWFVIPWYAIGIAGAFLVSYDLRTHNTPLKQAMKWAWPIIVLFFSVIGLALYYGTARAPGIAKIEDQERKAELHNQYEQNMGRRVNGAVIHCVAGDGLGIMTAMVIARAVNMSFWQEFWFEYLIGFLFGWFIFQFRSMMMMTDSKLMALGMAFRSEFMSMLTVMGGMGAVMGYVTPLAVTEQPDPLTYAFWGFGALGLLVGYVFTWPMNYLLVKVGWKHGMGSMDNSMQLHRGGPRYAAFATMAVMGAAALVIPAWLVEVRDGTPVSKVATPVASASPARAGLTPGLTDALTAALDHLERNERSSAAHAIDSAHRAAEVGHKGLSATAFKDVLDNVKRARHALHMGTEPKARRQLEDAIRRSRSIRFAEPAAGAPSLSQFRGATVLNSRGVMMGEITDIRDDQVTVVLGGARNVWGFLDLNEQNRLTVPAEAVVTGPERAIGMPLIAIPALDDRQRLAEIVQR